MASIFELSLITDHHRAPSPSAGIALTSLPYVPYMFSMGIETLGEAWNLSWQIHVRCLDDGREGLKHMRACGYKKYLDLETIVCTRGRDFPIARIAERLRCPSCGCRQVAVMFSPPQTPQTNPAAARPYRDVRYANGREDD